MTIPLRLMIYWNDFCQKVFYLTSHFGPIIPISIHEVSICFPQQVHDITYKIHYDKLDIISFIENAESHPWA